LAVGKLKAKACKLRR